MILELNALSMKTKKMLRKINEPNKRHIVETVETKANILPYFDYNNSREDLIFMNFSNFHSFHFAVDLFCVAKRTNE